MQVRCKILSPHARLPVQQTLWASGLDLHAGSRRGLLVGESALIPTGLALEIPYGYEGQIRPRSGLALKHGVTVLNAPGTIDADYRGEVCVLLINLGPEPVEIQQGDRIAQLVIAPVQQVTLVAVDDLTTTSRGNGGFGSTGQ